MKIVDLAKPESRPPMPSLNIPCGTVFRAGDTDSLYLKTTDGIVNLKTFFYFPNELKTKIFCYEVLDVELVIKGVLPAGG